MRAILRRGSRRIHLFIGVYLSGFILAILVIALADTGRYPTVSDPNILLGTVCLVAGTAFVVAERLEKAKVLGVIVPVATLTALASGLYTVTLTSGPPGRCSFMYVNRGFPLAWDSTYDIFLDPCILLRYLPVNPARGAVFFSLDVIFYVAIGLAIIQFYRGITGKTIIARSSQVNKMV